MIILINLVSFKTLSLFLIATFQRRLIDRGVINGKTGKAVAIPKFSDMLTLSQTGGADYAHPLALLALKNSLIMPLQMYLCLPTMDSVNMNVSMFSFANVPKICPFFLVAELWRIFYWILIEI